MKLLRQLVQDWPSRLALVLCFITPALMFSKRSSLPESAIGWMLFPVGVIFLSAFLSVAEILMVVFIGYAHRAISRWGLLAVSAAITVWVAHFVTYPFKTASSMAITIMNAAMIGAAVAGTVGGVILYLDKRIR